MMNHLRLTYLIGVIAVIVCSACDPKADSINGEVVDAASPEPDATADAPRPYYYCQGLSETQCLQDPECQPLEAMHYYPSEGCFREELAGCLPRGEGCNGLLTVAVDPDDACWWFETSCMTDGAAGSVDYSLTATFDAGPCDGIHFDAPLCN
jgi:hypothetical protein